MELDVVKGSYQLLKGSSVGYQTDSFEGEVINLLDNELRITLYIKYSDSLF